MCGNFGGCGVEVWRALWCLQVAPLREAAPQTTRFVLVTATLAEPVYLQLQQDFPGITPAFGPGERARPGLLLSLLVTAC